MTRWLCAIAAAAVVLGMVGRADARGHGGFHHGGSFHGHSGARVFVGGGIFLDPFYPYPYAYPYPYYWPPYPYPAYGYPPPPPSEDPGWSTAQEEPAGEPGRAREADAGEERSASYGLVQLHGVRDGASVDLDGRFWLTAQALDGRWLALPEGTHTITVRVRGAKPIERRVDVRPGTTRVVRFSG